MADVTLRNTATNRDLITKVRKLTARAVSQMSDLDIVDYINQVYEFDLPQELKVFDFKRTYEFTTEPNVDEYTLSQDDRNNYKSFEPPIYVDGYNISYFQNRDMFFGNWPRVNTAQDLSTGTNVVGPYTGTLSGTPVLRKSVLISAINAAGTTLTAIDNGSGVLTGDVSAGTVNYTTGAISVTFSSAIPTGNTITARYNQYAAARPQAVLFYDNVFTLRPIPDAAYKVQIEAYLKPTAYNYTGGDDPTRPYLDSYFQFLAYGAALKIFADSTEMDSYAQIRPLYEEQLTLIGRKTIMQIRTQRTPTIYTDNMIPNRNLIY